MRKIIPTLVFVCLCFACTNNKQNADNAGNDTINSEALIGAEPFSEFIEKFHKDSLFAMTRISEKTEGFDSDLVEFDSLKDDFVGGECFWTKDEMRTDWSNINYLRTLKDEYNVKYEVKADTASEYIFAPQSDCFIYLYFALKSKKWHLVGLNHNNL